MNSRKLSTDVVTNMLPFLGRRSLQPAFSGGTNVLRIRPLPTKVRRHQPSSAVAVNLSKEDRKELRAWQAEMESFDRF